MLALVATAATTQAFLVIATVLHGATSPPPGWITLVAILAVACVFVALVARRHGAPATCHHFLIHASSIVVGLGLGLVRTDHIFTPTPWNTATTATLTGFVESLENERMVLASPCIEHADGAPLEPPACDGPEHITIARDTLDEAPVFPGMMVRVEVELRSRRRPDNPTALPPPAPAHHGQWARALADVLPSPALPTPWHAAAAAEIRQRLTFQSDSGARATALYTALILGDRSDIAPTTRHAYQDTGTAHLLAISGFNLALFGFGLFRIALFVFVRLPWFRTHPVPARFAALLAIAFTATYTAIAAPSDATDRALIAIVLTLGVLALGFEARGLRTLGLCLLAALILDPTAFTRAGFQLSFAATMSLILAVPLVRKASAYLSTSKHLPSPFVRRLTIGLVGLMICDLLTHLATMPIGLVWFGQSSPHALWVNLIAIPWMSLIVFPAGLIQLGLATVAPDLAALTDPLVAAIGVSFETFIINAGDIIGSQQTITWPWWLGWTAALLVLIALSRMARPVAIAASLGIAAIPLVLLALHHDSDLRIDVLDVGHGDAIVIRHPDAGVMLVDTGGAFTEESSRSLAERTLVPALGALGIAKIDILVITHADRDHIGAAPALAARLPIREVWLPPCAFEHPTARALAANVARHGGHARPVAAQPPTAWGDARIDILWPPADSLRHDGTCRLHSNDASLVLRLVWHGHSILLTGDIEAEAEAALVEAHGNFLKSDVLKVPHHGSRTSSTPAFVDAVDPSLALVSGLVDNPPMPPHPAILEDYRERGIALRVTGLHGAIGLTWSRNGDSRLATRRPPETRNPRSSGDDSGFLWTSNHQEGVRSP
jgi:competence protein ComEC